GSARSRDGRGARPRELRDARRARERPGSPACARGEVRCRPVAEPRREHDRGRTTVDVLFVCVRNLGRSQIAAALLRARAGSSLVVAPAGSRPAETFGPAVRLELRRRGLDGLIDFPRPLTSDMVRASRFVVTMGCGDACPVIPGRHYLDWPVADPAGAAP